MDYTISEKEKMLYDFKNIKQRDYKYKINTIFLQLNSREECYRDNLVSYFQMAPMIDTTVPLEEADYILYANPFARIEDFTENVLYDLDYINHFRKEGAEIIIVGKATNIKPYIDGRVSNVTYVDSHYAEYISKRFEYNFKEQYVVYDDRNDELNIWPVDGCLRKCGFCRRTYMNIPFESQRIEFIKERLDWFKNNHPEQMENISLRAENLTEYGIDIYGRQRLDEIIRLVDSYEEIKNIMLPIGMCISEINDNILQAILDSKKIKHIALNIEAGSNRLLKVIGKGHTKEQAIEICNKIINANPNIKITSTVMIGLPTEEISDMLELSDTILKSGISYVRCNYYGYSPKHPLAKYPQIDDNVKKLHLSYLIRTLKKNHTGKYLLQVGHEKIDKKITKKVIREKEKLREYQKYSLPKLIRWEYENFIGNDMSIKQENLTDIAVDTDNKIKQLIIHKKMSNN